MRLGVAVVSHTPGPWHTGGTFNPTLDPRMNVWGPTPEGKQSGSIIAQHIKPDDARLIARTACQSVTGRCAAARVPVTRWILCLECIWAGHSAGGVSAMKRIEVVREDCTRLSRQRWAFFYDYRSGYLRPTEYCVESRSTVRHKFRDDERWSHIDRRHNTLSSLVLPDDVRDEAVRLFCIGIVVKEWE